MTLRHSAGPTAVTLAVAIDAGLLEVGRDCSISPDARFVPSDEVGTLRPIVLGDGCAVGPHAIIHGGTRFADDVRVEPQVIVGQPERGYAKRHRYPGAGTETWLGSGVVLRGGAIVYAGVRVDDLSTVGHQSLIRSHVRIGPDCELTHNLVIERNTRIGAHVRMSPHTHLTSDTVVGDHVLMGGGIRTLNNNSMLYGDPNDAAELLPPSFGAHCRIGAGATILGGVEIGEGALVGAGAVVTRSVPAGSQAYGVPARAARLVGQAGGRVGGRAVGHAGNTPEEEAS